MPTKKRVRGNPSPLIVEDHPSTYEGYPFITLIQHRNQEVLTIIDNADEKTIRAYVLDLCGPERVDESKMINIASTWYFVHKHRYPLSIEFSRLGLTSEATKIYRTYQTEFVTRVIGPLPKYEMVEISSVRRRRRKAVPPGVEIHKRIIALT